MRPRGILKQPASVTPAVFGSLLDGADRAPAVLRVEAPAGTVHEAAPTPEAAASPASPRPLVVAHHTVRVAPHPVRVDPVRAEAPPPASRPAPPQGPPPPRLTPEEQRAQLEAEARARQEAAVAAAREEAFAEGRAAGYAAAEEALRAEVERLKAAVRPDIERLEALWHAHHERVERQLVSLAIEVAAMLTAGPLPDGAREAADRAFVQAVEALAQGKGLSVQLHPVDYLRLQEIGLADGLNAAHPALRWVPDEHLAEGDWIVDTAEAAVRSVRAELLEGLRARLDLLQAIQDAPRVTPRVAAPPAAAAEPTGTPSVTAPE